MSEDDAFAVACRFAAALDAMQSQETEQERVVPIAELFYEDGGPTVVQPAANPPTSPAERLLQSSRLSIRLRTSWLPVNPRAFSSLA